MPFFDSSAEVDIHASSISERTNALNGPTFEERVLLVKNGRRIGEHNGYGVEADLVPLDSGARGVTSCCANDMFLFFAYRWRDRDCQIPPRCVTSPRQTRRVSITRDDIDLGISAGPIISSDDLETSTTQITMCEVFAAPAQGRICLTMSFVDGIALRRHSASRVTVPGGWRRGIFDRFELPFDYFAAYQIAEIKLPKPPKTPGTVHKQFKAEISPQSK